MNNTEILKNVVDLSMSSVEVSVSAAHILSGTREVQKAATSMASAVEELAASIGEIENAAQRSSHAVMESSDLTSQGMRELSVLKLQVQETGTVFETVSVKTKDLQNVVSNLGQVVELISKVAGQTNLLALNATIEAARAGEHGKGFAVVAGEVKSLSRQTTEATETIRTQIQLLNDSFSEVLGSVSNAQSIVHSVIEKTGKVSQDFDKINQNSTSISSQVTELASIISQQKMAVELLAQNMTVVKEKGDINLNAVDVLTGQTDKSVKLIEDWRAQLANEDIENKVIYLAQADYLLWKKRLLDMAIGKSQMKASDLTDHTLCRLGKWYYSDQASEFRNFESFIALEAPHKKVHYHGIEAAKLFEKGQIQDGMNHYNLLEQASAEVIQSLQSLLQIKSKQKVQIAAE
ncbi:MAG: methyl-accepting chemotaxis protein [Alphaproteobacteria bacterium]|nr:CZB domain-containing protein [Alphaproteobacteria bacterium]